MKQSAWSMVALVASREIRTRVYSKVFLLTSGLFVLAIVGGGAFLHFFGPDGDEERTVGITSQAAAIGPAIEAVSGGLGTAVTVEEVGRDAGERQVRDGDLDALVDGASSDLEIVVDSELDPTLRSIVTTAAQQQTLGEQISALGGDPAQVAESVAGAEPQVTSLDGDDQGDPAQVVAGFVAGILIFIALMGGGQRVAQGVVEEKASRVVELLLATMRPWQLMAGKVLGNFVVGVLEVGIIAAAAVGTAWGFDLLETSSLAVGTVAVWVLVWFLVGFIMYALLLASLAALVSRQEDVGSVISPVIGLMMVPYVVGVSIAPWDPENTLVEVLSYVPFCSPFIMPIRIALDTATLPEILASIGISVVLIPFLVWLAGRIYSGAILRTGARVSLRQALRSNG